MQGGVESDAAIFVCDSKSSLTSVVIPGLQACPGMIEAGGIQF
jgi:hypothetical protein